MRFLFPSKLLLLQAHSFVEQNFELKDVVVKEAGGSFVQLEMPGLNALGAEPALGSPH